MTDSGATEVGRSGVLFLIGTGLSMMSGFLFRIALSNLLDVSAFGSVMLAISVLGIIAIPANMGLNQGILKYYPESSREETNSFITLSLLVVASLSTLSIVALFYFGDLLLTTLFDDAVGAGFFLLFLLSIPVFSTLKFVRDSLRGARMSRGFVFLTKVFQPSSRLVLAGLAAYLYGAALAVYFGVLASLLLTLGLAIAMLYRSGWRPQVTSSVDYSRFFRFSFPLMLSSTIYVLLSRVDRVFLGYFRSPDLIGIYEVAFALALLLSAFRAAFSFIMLPTISDMVGDESTSEIAHLYRQVTKWILISTTPALLILLIRPGFLVSLFGDQYPLSAVYVPLSVLAVTQFLDAVTGPNGDALLAWNKSKTVMLYNLAALAVNLILNVLLIPDFGATGAAVALFAGYTTANILKAYDLLVNHDILVFSWPSFKASAVMTVFFAPFLYALPSLQLLVEIPLLSAAFVVAVGVGIGWLYVTGELTTEDVELLRIND